ncbi:hypothetical protein [Entomospira culicis]|uniref:Uncharacterized protein n=1 Tax=Entomospira culicis TaxID=2719989 RepID=A0A968KWQ7_9SPIO|nr:hypothetical protein [Entomospira culicis]NIZ19578.1 hypothetical protein [Entomospira culicis]NIZ69517.1 hypothetical protein [Entomospira culicis]WDI36630.1 hypothetical protein PVA46_04715 [Entomospira culicis]WDI38259.1 hypothetical protein PVA47_04725 [Entomospira culicis]
MKKIFMMVLLLWTATTAGSQEVLETEHLEHYGRRFRQALYQGRVPKVNGGMIDFYQLEGYFRKMKPKDAQKIATRHKKSRKGQYGELAMLLYRPISRVFGISYDPEKVSEPNQFFTSSVGLELIMQVMSRYITDEGKLDGKLLHSILDLFDDELLLDVNHYLRPVMMEYIAADLVGYPFKKEDHRQQILDRAMGILLFAYYPYQLTWQESALMWEEVQANPKNLIHKFGNIDYPMYHQVMDRGAKTLAKITNVGTTQADRDAFNAYLLREIFNNDIDQFNQTLNASRAFLRSDELEKKIFLPY